jgi:DHA2 family multidrug resistance protein
MFMLRRNQQVAHADLTGHVTPFNQALHWPGVADAWNLATTAGRTALDAEITRQAAIIAYNDDYRLMMIVSLLCLPLVFLLRKPPAAGPRPAQAVLD